MPGIGTANLRKHRQGGRLTPLAAILAKCSDCTCDYADGREDCAMPRCPLYFFMPYRAGHENGTKRRQE